MRSILALVLAVLLAALAWWCHATAPQEWAAALPGLHADYEDTRTLPAAQRAAHAARQQQAWRERVALLAAALALGALSQAARRGALSGPEPSAGRGALRARGPSLKGALAVAALGVFVFAGWTSVTEQLRLQREGRWALSDDSLPLYAGPLAPRLAEWRTRVGPHDAVLLAGRQDLLLNVVATALHGRPIFPLLQAVPVEATGEQLRALSEQVSLGADAPKRWLIDLDALASRDPAAFAHPLLLELER